MLPRTTIPMRQGVLYRPQLQRRFISDVLTRPKPSPTEKQLAPLSRLPMKTLLRSLVLTSLMTRSWLLRPSLSFLVFVTNSKSKLWNPDRNQVLNTLLRLTIYNHFCAGSNRVEVSRSVDEVKKQMGYQGVILGYSKEVVLDPKEGKDSVGGNGYSAGCYVMIDQWKEGTLETLRMIGAGDFLAVKLTGAGPISVDALQARQPMPKAVKQALDVICSETAKQGSRLWFDAEQQVLQPGLDEWAIELMRRYNRNGQALVYNTIQGYLKESQANVDRHLTLAAQEDFAVGIKLVRGAYIEHEVRSSIHDTKEGTDRSYDQIADTLISQRKSKPAEHLPFPPAALFLATHNAESVEKAFSTYRHRLAAGLPTVPLLECGQIQGMADELSCDLLQQSERDCERGMTKTCVPRIFKCLTWGSVGECMGYLHRRAIENRGAVERCHHMTAALKRELWRRLFRNSI